MTDKRIGGVDLSTTLGYRREGGSVKRSRSTVTVKIKNVRKNISLLFLKPRAQRNDGTRLLSRLSLLISLSLNIDC